MIHRTRVGKPPSGGPVAGRTIVELGGRFVEYSGAVPDQAALDAHLAPPLPAATPLTIEDVERLLLGLGVGAVLLTLLAKR